ncbi:MAG TPA: phage tail sheath subtilisin-like domain-containing protein [Verrucomicrobiota bacterium]|nr:phage tail sheath family protein [Verrucomicrobiales bacterium]HRI12572.1 phage tail sheath subtilisin-like domain-containing protein [Verrucomicrobiota bacterium]
MIDYKTPGVYVEETATLPASVVQVPTAIPAFIGVTAKKPEKLTGFSKIGSLLEYENAFGQGAGAKAYLYSSIKLFYANGGGDAYVYSVGGASTALNSKLFTDALAALEKVPEPTLILFPDAVNLSTGLEEVQKTALKHCYDLRGRFCILDAPTRDSLLGSKGESKLIAAFRTGVGTSNLDYGAAYGPWLQVAAPAGSNEPTEVPASGAVAGVYASVDAQRGVWKAPANVSLNGVVGLTEAINDHDQESLNVDTDGKSINAIRAFPGKGVLVWGARTLKGNDNEWRYVSVRRLFILAEESIRRSTAFVVFEPNDANTWIKVKAMIENFLTGLWRQGALAGAKPEQAFFVNVGLGTTMTPQDVLEGRMIVNVGMAAVRPSEFVVIRFSHKLQTA